MLPIPNGWGQMSLGFSGLGLRAGDLVGLPAKRTFPTALLPSLLALHLPPLALGPTHGSRLNDSLVSGLLGAIRTMAATWLALASPLSRQSLIAPQIHLLGGESLIGSNFWILSLSV